MTLEGALGSMEYREAKEPPDRWQDFEDLCLKLWRPRLIDAKKHGRSGQPDAGVDVFGRDPATGELWGIQCKQRGRWPKKVLTASEIQAEIEQAETFDPPLAHFIVATSAPRNAELQRRVLKLSEQRRDAGQFTVDLFAWDDLQEWLHEGSEAISREKALWVWRQRILRLHSRLMPYFQERSAPLLEHVYVELQLDSERLSGASGREAHADARFQGRRLSIRDVLNLDPSRNSWITRRWLLRGDPGSGKTTLLRHLAWSLAAAAADDDDDDDQEPLVPVFESLPRLMAEKPSVFERIEEDLDRADQPGAAIRRILEAEAKEGHLLLLLDGLDEVPREARARAEELLSELAVRWPNSPIVATTRPIGAWSPGADFVELRVLPFDADRRRTFLSRWFGQKGVPDREKAASVASVLEAHRSLRELASNPLYLTLLALLVQGGEQPARLRSKLYDQIFDLLEEGRHHKPATPIDNRAVAHLGLQRLAYKMTRMDRDGEALPKLELRLLKDEQVRRLLQAGWPSLRSYLTDIAEKTGILGPHDGDAAPWRFWHRTFREALAAEALAEKLEAGEPGWQSLIADARRIAAEDAGRWAEPYALLAGRVEKADALVKALVKANQPLGLRAVATAQGLDEETLLEILQLSGGWKARRQIYERLPQLIDDPIRVLALVDQLRQQMRNGNDLFFLEEVTVAVGVKWPEVSRACADLRRRFYDHIPPPAEELFRWIETPHDGKVELWREIPAGRYTMGSRPEEKGRGDWHGPQHEVRITEPFWLASVPVTMAQYATFEPEYSQYRIFDGPHRPVNSVTWYQAAAFCRWLSASWPWARGARLPTEEEWEYACRAETWSRYWSGDGETDLQQVGWYDKNSDIQCHPVGEKPGNPWGLYDVHGNVWEWTLSEGRPNYYGRESGVEVDPAAVDSEGFLEGPSVERVIRGGSYRNTAPACQSSYRETVDPEGEFDSQGFRVLLSSACYRPSLEDSSGSHKIEEFFKLKDAESDNSKPAVVLSGRRPFWKRWL